ncbi:MAG: hypothetical protein D5R96_06960 [Methanocalculus sp. MSAO_Arc2]|nr:MAG: hypothetical protein D5R96_06960 [Methanocalculus sp. MSAO_Arc2]
MTSNELNRYIYRYFRHKEGM